jgi:integrase/recombinase XerD
VAVVDPCLIRSVDASGRPVLRLGVPLLDAYLDFVAGRCRPNTVLAAAYDLKILFAVVGKDGGERYRWMSSDACAAPASGTGEVSP